MNSYINKKILVLGAGRSGLSVARLVAKENEVVLTDVNELEEKIKLELEGLGVKIIITNKQEDILDNTFDLILKNPGVMPSSAILDKASKLSIKVENEMEVAYHFLPKDITIIGVTGSNGKTTTVTLIYEILKRMNKNIILAGNIGIPLSDVVNKVKEKDIILLEISDHQLLNLDDFKTNVSLLTNICPTHLDYHGTFEKYKLSKKRIFNHHSKTEIAIINKSNQDSVDITCDIMSNKLYFCDSENYYDEEAIYIDKEEIVKIEDIFIKGKHNYENIISALMVVKLFGIDKITVQEFLKTFAGVEHRIEFVREINTVRYYNDTKATNPTSTITALKTFDKPVHLILGGLERTQDFNELNDYIKNVKCIYAIGEVTDRIYDYSINNNLMCEKCYTLKEAVKKINYNNLLEKGEVVLLSPASASQDQYKNFEERGKEFKKIINLLKS